MKIPLELIYNLRLLKKNFGFVAICVLMISLGMGLTITMYSISENIDTRPYPFDGGEKFVTIFGVDTELSPDMRRLIRDGFIYQTLETAAESFETLGAYIEMQAVLSDGDYSEGFLGVAIKPELFQATNIIPLMGRSLLPEDAIPDAEKVALISYRAWQSYYAGNESIIGTSSRINGEQHRIVGVMPEGFIFPQTHDIWTPLQLPAAIQPEEYRSISIQGVLRDEVTPEAANIEVSTILNGLNTQNLDIYESMEWRVRECCRLINPGGDPVAGTFLLPMLTIALLLLICLNVANLILVRTNQRIHEFTIRTALGASRKRLVIVVLQDSLLICLLGALLGLVFADLGLSYVNVAASSALEIIGGLPYTFNFGWETGTAITAVATVVVIWLLSAGLAIWQVSRRDLSVSLAGGKSGATESQSAFGTATMVSIEVIFSCFLLVLTGVLIGASIDSTRTDYGTAVEGYLTGRIDLPLATYSGLAEQNAYRRNLEMELLSESGIDAVSYTTALPSQGARSQFFDMEDRDLQVDGQYPRKGIVYIADNYFDVMGVNLQAGRSFDIADTLDSLPVVIIDELFADEMWPNQPNPQQFALGQRVRLNPGDDPGQWQTATIVGVIPHIIQGVAMDQINRTSFYRPLSQRCCDNGELHSAVSVVFTTQGNPQEYRQPFQEAAARVDRDVPISFIYTITDWLNVANSVMVFASEVSSGMAFLTLVLAVTGILAIVSRSVRQRTKEIGIRRAIGSSDLLVLAVFIKQGFRYLILGLLIGGGGAILISNAINSESVGLVEWLPTVVTAVTLGLAMLVFLATYTPALSLIKMEPGETLRDE